MLGEGNDHRVRKVDTSGIITTAMGNGIITYSLDGTLAIPGGVNEPSDFAFDDLGNFYVADSVSVAITKIDIADPPSLSFPNTNVGSASAAQDVTVWNDGNATLTFSHTIPYGDFTLNGPDTTCIPGEEVLSVDATCVFGIEFAPLTSGPQSGKVVMTDNAFNGAPATQTIPTSGTGIGGPAMPTVTTAATSAITQTTATGGGNVTADGGATVTGRGACWSTSVNPTTAGACASSGAGTGSFTASITGLSPNTLYHVRAFATNSIGTAYGSDLTFNTLSAATPTINWTPATPITYGAALGSGDFSRDSDFRKHERQRQRHIRLHHRFGGRDDSDGQHHPARRERSTLRAVDAFFELHVAVHHRVRVPAHHGQRRIHRHQLDACLAHHPPCRAWLCPIQRLGVRRLDQRGRVR